MAGFRIDTFRGLRPRVSAKKLRPGEAITAQNLKLGAHDLEPIPEKSTTQAVGSGRSSRSIYLFDNNGSPIWFEWDDYVDVARGPVKDDTLERTYYTGDTLGNGAPKVTTTDLADLGNGGPYPEDWYYIGVPAPANAPTVTKTPLPEDSGAGSRLAEQFSVASLVIDQVKWTNHAGASDAVWNLNSAATGSIQFDIQPGTSFKVVSVISNNRVTLESATEPGVTMRTANSDKTTVNDWHPMDNNGGTHEADWIGWRIPAGMEARIVDHNLNVGDVIVVSALNHPIEFWASNTDDFTESNWAIEAALEDGGSTFYQTLDAAVTGETYTGEGVWRISGSFYYDVERAASDTNELEDRSYVYTYVNSFGEEGPPSAASTAVSLLDGQSALLSNLALPPTIGYNIENIRVYRTNSTEAGTEFQFVKEVGVVRSVRDGVLSKNLGEVLATTTWDPPDPNMKGIVALPNGMLAGFYGKQLYFCEPYFPHAWPPEYDQAVEYDIVGLAVMGNSLVVMTKGWPYVFTGSHPRNMNGRAVKVNQACLSKEGIATDGNRVYYPSPDGLVEISPTGIEVKTQTLLDPEDWMAYVPSTMVGEFYEGRYYGFWGFDVTAVDPVITAELSGTITYADRADIVAGGRTIIITLQGDTWLAAGTAFDNQRQNIIDGLDCSTDQTLGWNNIMRDSAIQVGNVVRTSDTVVTITLPVETGYVIAQGTEEVVTCTVPSTAMVLSNSAVVCGSTFTILPAEAVATVTLTGTLGGAAEADVVSGGNTIIITLTNDTWVSTLTDEMKQLIVDGLKSSTNEIDGWNDRVPQEITASSAVVRTSDTVVTVTLPAVPLYSVTESESISATIPHSALAVQLNVDATSGNSLGIIATGVATALFGGTAIASMTENEVIAGGKVLTITLTNDTWIAAGTGPIGTTAQSEALLAAITATSDEAASWNTEVRDNFVVGDLVRTSNTVATITLGAESAYAITANETIGATFPAALFTAGEIISCSNTFAVTNQAPVICEVSGTITSSTVESDIVDGGKTIILTLTEDTWLAAGTGPIGSTANTQAIIDGIDSAQSEGTGWDAVVKAGLVPATHVVRTSDVVCTITLPAFASYDTTADETITATIPAAALNISASAVVATPTFVVSYNPPASAAVTGTADGADSDDIIDGGKTIIITLTDDTWVASGAAFNAIRQDIIDGLDAASSPTNGWNNKVRDVIADTTCVRTSDTVVTITLPATSDYDVSANEAVTVTVPASATVLSGAIVASNTVDISAVSTTAVRIYVSEDDGPSDATDGRMHTSFLNPSHWYDYNPYRTGAGESEFIWSMAYLPGIPRLIVGVKEAADSHIYTSDTDGASWTERTSAISLTTSAEPRGMFFVDSLDGEYVFSTVEPFSVQYSSDGITWTDISTPVKAGSGDGTHFEQFLYGDDYIYARTDTGLIRSGSLVGAGDVEDNWGDEIVIFAHVGDTSPPTATKPAGSTYPAGSGNGKILATYVYNNLVEMQWCYFSHETWFVNSIGVKTLPSSTGKTIQHLVFGNDSWLLVDENAYGWLCDVTGQAITYDTDPANYTSLGAMVESGNMTVANCWYDTTLGFVLVGNVGVAAAEQTKVYTSPTGSTWTLRAAFDAESAARGPFSSDTSYSSTSQAVIKGTALDNVTGVPAEPTVPPSILTLNNVSSLVEDDSSPYTINAGVRVLTDGRLQYRVTSGGGTWTTQNEGVEWTSDGGATASDYEAKIERTTSNMTANLSGWSALNTWQDIDQTLLVELDKGVDGTWDWSGTLSIRQKSLTSNIVTCTVTLQIVNSGGL